MRDRFWYLERKANEMMLEEGQGRTEERNSKNREREKRERERERWRGDEKVKILLSWKLAWI